MVQEAHEHKRGDIVYLIRRKANGHPRGLKDGVGYEIWCIEGNNDILCLNIPADDFVRFKQHVKVHKKYMSGLSYIRNKKLEELLDGDV